MSDGAALEASLPEPQRWLNGFCENWLFAFLVAMSIRHFVLEAFRIPTASMEPMLYGDPGFFTGDNVVVDKLTRRFRGVQRWDVTVFQFPQPEVESPNGGRGTRPAIDADGERLERLFLRPLTYSNFVKRAIALPGDRFYIANGDLHVWDDAKHAFGIARKPARTQEALWQPVLHHGAQPDYLPWEPSGGATVTAVGEQLKFSFSAADAAVRCTQPFSNVYLKPGAVRAVWLPAPLSDLGNIVEVSMVKPLFTAAGRPGNLWDFEHWRFLRLTTKDLDSTSHGPVLNDAMNEYVGDLRVSGTLTALTGTVVLSLKQGGAAEYALTLSDKGWALGGTATTSGSDAVIGKAVSLAHLDGQVIVTIDGVEKVRTDVPEVDPNVQRASVAFTGAGSAAASSSAIISGLRIDRDLHYANRGFLADASAEYRISQNQVITLTEGEGRDNSQNSIRSIETTRAQMRGKSVEQLTLAEKTARWGYSPETAITVPAGAYLMLGDNSPLSLDGRMWGFVPAENLRGRALAVLLPWTRWRIVR